LRSGEGESAAPAPAAFGAAAERSAAGVTLASVPSAREPAAFMACVKRRGKEVEEEEERSTPSAVAATSAEAAASQAAATVRAGGEASSSFSSIPIPSQLHLPLRPMSTRVRDPEELFNACWAQEAVRRPRAPSPPATSSIGGEEE